MMFQFQGDAAKWKEKLADKQEDQQASKCEQQGTMLREVLTEPADSVKLSVGLFLLPTILVQLSHTPWVKHWLLPWDWGWKPSLSSIQDSRALMPLGLWLSLCQQAAQCLRVTLHLLQPSRCLTFKPPALQSGSHPSHSSLVPNTGNMIILPTLHLTMWQEGSHQNPSMMMATDPMSIPDQLPLR